VTISSVLASLKLSLQVILLVLAAVLAAWFSHRSSYGTYDVPQVHPSWKTVFENPSGMANAVDEIVLAEVVETSPGRVVSSGTPDGDYMQFDDVQLLVQETFKGRLRPSEEFTIERTRGSYDDFGNVGIFDADGGDFVPGNRYILFLETQEESPSYLQVNHQARFAVDGSLLQATAARDEVARHFHDSTLTEFRQMIRRLLRG
jgi:hypothetical protein